MSRDKYESPLSSRYASGYMLGLFSADTRYQTWRRLWVALARAEHELGLPVSAEQIAELEAHVTDIDYDFVAEDEKRVRHDVMVRKGGAVGGGDNPPRRDELLRHRQR